MYIYTLIPSEKIPSKFSGSKKHTYYKVRPPNAISWFITPINYSYIYHKP